MIKDKFVEMIWVGTNIKYYQNLGYEFTKKFDKFNVKIEDLNKNSHIKINATCDKCNKPMNVEYRAYISHMRDGKCYCKKCAINLYGKQKLNEVRLEKSISFADYCIQNVDENFIEKYWGKKNIINPFDILFRSNVKVWIKCQEKNYHGEYLIYPYDFVNGVRCGYCYNAKVHKSDSFGEKYPIYSLLWSDKNKKSPYDYKPLSHKKVLWKCENELHDDYERSITVAIKCDGRCPECTRERKESLLQEKVRKYLSEDLGYKLNHEFNCNLLPINPKTNYPLPFDNEIIDLCCICEVMGQQHEDENNNFYKLQAKHKGTTIQEEFGYQKWKDEYKKQYALLQGYSYLAISYKTEKDESYKTLIDEKIKEIQNINI